MRSRSDAARCTFVVVMKGGGQTYLSSNRNSSHVGLVKILSRSAQQTTGKCLKGVWRESMGYLNGILVSQDW